MVTCADIFITMNLVYFQASLVRTLTWPVQKLKYKIINIFLIKCEYNETQNPTTEFFSWFENNNIYNIIII